MAESVPKILEPNPYINDPYVMSGVILNEEAWLMLDQLSEIPSNSEYPYKKKRKRIIEELLEYKEEEITTLNDTELFDKYKKIDEDQQILKKALLEEEKCLQRERIQAREEMILKLKEKGK
jgi:hypothetical protein